MAFEPITTQEQLDKFIGERLAREREKYADYDALKAKAADVDKISADFEQRITALNQAVTDKDTKIKELESKNTEYATAAVKMRICSDYGLPLSMADRLRGANEDEIRKDAESLRGYFVRPVDVPKKDADTLPKGNAELLNMLKTIKG